MIIGIALRNFKVYKNINYMPISHGSNFTGIIGTNGIGKSSIMEALDCFFNNKPWLLNVDSKKEDSWIMPIFAIQKSKVDNEELTQYFEKVTEYVLSEEQASGAQKKSFDDHLVSLRNNLPDGIENGYYIVPVAKGNGNDYPLAIFNYTGFRRYVFNAQNDESSDCDEKATQEFLKKVYEWITEMFTYVYVPSDILPEHYIAFENDELQRLMGASLSEIVSKSISKKQIDGISAALKADVEKLSKIFGDYEFRARGSNQPNLKVGKVHELVIKEFFSVRELNKKTGGNRYIPLSQLSSGEKQQAIIKVIVDLVTKYRENSKDLIIAVDEPESSLHISRCYDQFEQLLNLSHSCAQVIVTSHWYGFIPVLVQGNILYIYHKETDKVEGMVLNAENYRAEMARERKNHELGLPRDIVIKAENDFTQSVISSIIRENNEYNWLICEGVSDKVYLKEYLKKEVETRNLRIVPAGSAKEVKKLYSHLVVPVKELKEVVKGKIFLLTDTDRQLVQDKVDQSVEDRLLWKRIVNEDKETKLVNPDANPVSPNTDIEAALNGLAYYHALSSFCKEHQELSFLEDIQEPEEVPSGIALDMRQSQKTALDEFFNKDKGAYKIRFATEYVRCISSQPSKYCTPNWIQEIRNFFD